MNSAGSRSSAGLQLLLRSCGLKITRASRLLAEGFSPASWSEEFSQTKSVLLEPSVTPATPPTLTNLLENRLTPYEFISVGGVGGMISPRAYFLIFFEAIRLTQPIFLSFVVVCFVLNPLNHKAFDFDHL